MNVLSSIPLQNSAKAASIDTDGSSLGGPQVVIVADDLTGACDSAASFVCGERTAWVWLHGLRGRDRLAGDIWSFSTESRNENSVVAGKRVRELIGGLRKLPLSTLSPSPLFFKKVDSAGRGCFAVEIAAMQAEMGAKLVVYSAGFPEAGRFLLDGFLHIHDAAGDRRRIEIRDLYPEQMHSYIALIPRGTDLSVGQLMRRAIEDGKYLLVCDTGSNEDIERIVRVAGQSSQPILWAGSAGLGRALARALPAGASRLRSTSGLAYGRTLVFAGSPHPATWLQISRLSQVSLLGSLPCITKLVRCGVSNEEELRRTFQESGPVGSLVLTGGDTASMILRALGADAIEIGGEMAVGIPWGIVHGGLANGCLIVTKSGGFGHQDVLVDAVHFCHGVTS